MRANDLWERLHFRGEDLRGKQFHFLLVVDLDRIHRNPSGLTVAYWKCRCTRQHDIEVYVSVAAPALRGGTTKSCGCFHKVAAGERVKTHGMSCPANVHPIYRAWTNMLSRCENPNHADYHNYGGRGITVCERWHAFENFRDNMLPTWEKGLTIERIDNALGGYCPENCKWITMAEQKNNRRITVFATINGEKKTVVEWTKILGVNRHTVMSRIWRNVTPEEALLTPIKSHSKPS